MDLSTSLHQSPKVQALVSKLHQKWGKDKSGKEAKWANFGVVEGAAIVTAKAPIVTAKAPPVGKSLSLGILQDTLDLL